MAGRTKTKVKTTRTSKRGAAASHRSSQGFVPLAVRQSISAAATWTASSESPQAAFNETNETVLTGSAGIRDGGAKCYKLLTEKAKSIIRSEISAGLYDNRKNELKPPFMPLSDDPDHYSSVRTRQFFRLFEHSLILQQWCTFCNDFAAILILCAGCAIGLCVKTTDHPTGCIEWNPKIDDDPDLVFYCPYCAPGGCMEVSTKQHLISRSQTDELSKPGSSR